MKLLKRCRMALKLLPISFSILYLIPTSFSNLSEEYQFKGKGTFWQFTDVHWDLRYSRNGDPNQLCHINKSKGENDNGYFGNYFCDSPWTLVQSAMVAMKKIQEKPDFILWTGDNAPHSRDPMPDYDHIFRTTSNITAELRRRFSDIPIIPVLGNHDASPKNNYPADNVTFYEEYLTKSGWLSLLSEEAQKEFSVGGYFSVPISPNMSVLSLNTNLYYKYNILGTNSKDPSGQFSWMEIKLDDARKKSQNVLITAHAPPGFWERNGMEPFFNESYNDDYVNLLNKYGDVIVAQIYGHEHTDTFRLFGSQEGKRSVAFFAPSLSPWLPPGLTGGTSVNPSIRLYTYNSSDILDYHQYQLNLTEANNDRTTYTFCDFGSNYDPDKCQEELRNLWKIYYQGKTTFSAQLLNFESMASFLQLLKNDDSLVQKYYRINSAGVQHPRCDEPCKRTFLCAINHLIIDDFRSCVTGRITNECASSECKASMGAHVLVAGVVATISLTVMLGIMLIIVLARRRKTIVLGARSSTEFEWANRHRGYRPLSGDAD